jgi:hypothetical protein
MFLRMGCTTPDGLDIRQEQFCKMWMSVEDTISTSLDERVRNAGWHFLWLEDAYSCHGIGMTEASAIAKAITRALSQVKNRFNAAELDSIKISKYPGLWVARITLHARHIQHHASLSLIDEITIRQLAAANK